MLMIDSIYWLYKDFNLYSNTNLVELTWFFINVGPFYMYVNVATGGESTDLSFVSLNNYIQ